MIPSIQTYSGEYFNFLDPDNAHYTIVDIASALSKLCRYTGHTREFYSVAQHSVIVSRLVPEEHALAGLMHDAAEAFLGDVSSPLKQLLPQYKVIEARVEASIMRRFNILFPLDPCVKAADLVALVTERRDLLRTHKEDAEWRWTEHVVPQKERIFPRPHRAAKELFLARYKQLTA